MIELMTIGYEGLSAKEFFEILKRCRVETLVDVRELPISRKKGFSKSALIESTGKHGLNYQHLQTLGCPRDIRHDYRDDNDWKDYTKKFNKYLNDQKATMAELARLVMQSRCCLLCFEEDYNFCHRLFVAQRLASFVDDNLKISHLTGPIQGRVVVMSAAAAA